MTREGCVRIELRFKAPLKESVVMLTKVTYPGLFAIDYAQHLFDMNTNQLYDILWRDSTASSYVMAIVPSNALKYINSDRNERCYIVNCMKTRTYAETWDTG